MSIISSTKSVTVGNFSLPITEYKKQRVITLNMMDEVHQRVTGTARRNFNKHKAKLILNEDYFDIRQANEIRTLGFERKDGSIPEKIILLSETGYLMLVKSFTDELAWKVQRELVSHYFRNHQDEFIISPSQHGGITKAIVNKAITTLREEIHEELEYFKSSFDPSAAFVTHYKPMLAVLKEKEVPQKGRRPLSCYCSGRIHKYLIRVGKSEMIRLSRETGRYIYHVDGIKEWLEMEGNSIIRNHIDKIIGQGRLYLINKNVDA